MRSAPGRRRALKGALPTGAGFPGSRPTASGTAGPGWDLAAALGWMAESSLRPGRAPGAYPHAGPRLRAEGRARDGRLSSSACRRAGSPSRADPGWLSRGAAARRPARGSLRLRERLHRGLVERVAEEVEVDRAVRGLGWVIEEARRGAKQPPDAGTLPGRASSGSADGRPRSQSAGLVAVIAVGAIGGSGAGSLHRGRGSRHHNWHVANALCRSPGARPGCRRRRRRYRPRGGGALLLSAAGASSAARLSPAPQLRWR